MQKLLERQYEGYYNIRRQRRLDAFDAVLEEQSLQRSEGVADVDLLADIYHYISYECQIQAEMIGRQDAEEIGTHDYRKHSV